MMTLTNLLSKKFLSDPTFLKSSEFIFSAFRMPTI